MAGLLEGIRVFDMTVWMVGPWGSMQLGSLGADVIHIERPGVPMSERGAGVPPTLNGTSVGYVTWNMNKRSLYLDLKQDADREVAYRIIEQCDVFLVNMRPGVPERLGMGYSKLAEINPRLVYCAINGWGSSGPMVKEPGADGQMQGFSGFWSTNGHEGERGQFYRHFTQLDANTGNYAVQAILMALLAREKSGRGQRVEVPMICAASALQSIPIAQYLRTGRLPVPRGSDSQHTAPDHAFLCQDQQYIGVSVLSEEQWRLLCDLVGASELAEDVRFGTNARRVENRQALVAALEPLFVRYPQLYWVKAFTAAGVPFGYPLRFEQLRYHEQVQANGFLRLIDTPAWGTVYSGGPPWQMLNRPARWFRTPEPGEQSDEILREFGLVPRAGSRAD